MTYYEVLQISEKASPEIIEAAWKALMMVNHPDKGGNVRKAAKINEAHDILSDPKKRAVYDAQLAAGKAAKPRPIRMPSPSEVYPNPYQPEFEVDYQHIIQEMLNAGIQAGASVLSDELQKNPFVSQVLANIKAKKKRSAG